MDLWFKPPSQKQPFCMGPLPYDSANHKTRTSAEWLFFVKGLQGAIGATSARISDGNPSQNSFSSGNDLQFTTANHHFSRRGIIKRNGPWQTADLAALDTKWKFHQKNAGLPQTQKNKTCCSTSGFVYKIAEKDELTPHQLPVPELKSLHVLSRIRCSHIKMLEPIPRIHHLFSSGSTVLPNDLWI